MFTDNSSKNSRIQGNEHDFLNSSIQFFNSSHIPQTINLIMNHYLIHQKISSFQIASTNFQLHLKKLLEFICEKNMSFVLKYPTEINQKSNQQKNYTQNIRNNYKNYQIAAISLNLDIKDLLGIFQTQLNFCIFQQLGMITSGVRNSLYKLNNSQKGLYLFNIQTIFNHQKQQRISEKMYSLCKGIVFCKLVGWKNIVYATKDTLIQNPFVLLKLGGEIKDVIENKRTNRYNQVKSLLGNKQNQLISYSNLNLIKQHSYTYLIQLNFNKMHILNMKKIEKYIQLQRKRYNCDNFAFPKARI